MGNITYVSEAWLQETDCVFRLTTVRLPALMGANIYQLAWDIPQSNNPQDRSSDTASFLSCRSEPNEPQDQLYSAGVPGGL